MSAPVDLPREEAEVFFSEEKLHQDEAAPGGANEENPTGTRLLAMHMHTLVEFIDCN